MPNSEIKNINSIKEENSKGIILVAGGYIISEDISEDAKKLYTHRNNQISTQCLEGLKDTASKETDVILYSDYLSDISLSDVIDIASKKEGVSVVVDISNSGNEKRVLRLFSGDGMEDRVNGLYTPSAVDDIMRAYGMTEVWSKDILMDEQNDSGSSYLETENTLLKEYLIHAKGLLDKSSKVDRIIREYKKTSKRENKKSQNSCFLSIIMRTQGKRKTELEEALLSVYGQSDQDYEVLLMGHNLDEEGHKNVEKIIGDTPKALRDKIRYIDVVGGTRTTPLIRGFEEAGGEYVSILDDDDIVFDNWIEVFHKLSKDNHGKILHAYCAKQEWIRIQNPYGGDGLRANGPFERLYCRDFDEISQLSCNTCPIHSLAFPKSAYERLGMRFDESLNVVEDWDFLMRSSFVCGVANAQEMTSIYRIWKNTVNSAALHNQQEWDDSRKYIIDKFDSSPMLIPKGAAGRIVELLMGNTATVSMIGITKLWTFFAELGDGKGFLPDKMIPENVNVLEDGKFKVEYSELDGFGKVTGVRFDPSEDCWITMWDLKAELTYDDGAVDEVSADGMDGNGILIKDKLVFFENDPQIIIKGNPDKGIVGAKLTGKVNYNLDDDGRKYLLDMMKDRENLIQTLSDKKKKSLFRRGK